MALSLNESHCPDYAFWFSLLGIRVPPVQQNNATEGLAN